MSTPATFEDVWKMFQETDRRFKETDRRLDQRFHETDQQFRQVAADINKVSAHVDKVSAHVDKVSSDIGKLGNRLGEFVEGLVAPAVVRLFQSRGIPVHEVHRRVEAAREDVDMEVDLLVINDEDLVAIEVKSKLSVQDVDEFVERLGDFKRAFPHYRDATVMGGCAAMVMPQNVSRYAYRQGLFVIGQRGDTVEIMNDEKFQPRAW